jgi:hypothetical protein
MRPDGEKKINMVKYCVGCSVGLIPAKRRPDLLSQPTK